MISKEDVLKMYDVIRAGGKARLLCGEVMAEITAVYVGEKVCYQARYGGGSINQQHQDDLETILRMLADLDGAEISHFESGTDPVAMQRSTREFMGGGKG